MEAIRSRGGSEEEREEEGGDAAPGRREPVGEGYSFSEVLTQHHHRWTIDERIADT